MCRPLSLGWFALANAHTDVSFVDLQGATNQDVSNHNLRVEGSRHRREPSCGTFVVRLIPG